MLVKSEPYSSYEKFDFEIPTQDRKRCLFAVSCPAGRNAPERAELSSRRWKACQSGAWTADAPKIVLPEREKMKTQMEALIYHFKIVTEGIRVPAGEVYQVTESPRGEIGYYIVSDGSTKPHRVYMRTPSFGNLQALPRDDRRPSDCGYDRFDGQYGLCAGRYGPVMTFSPELEAENHKAG